MATTIYEKENTLDYREIRLEGAKAEVYSEGFEVITVTLISGSWLNNGNGGEFTPDPSFKPVVYDVKDDYNLQLLVLVLEEVKTAEINQETGKSFSLYYASGDYGYITGDTLQAVKYGSDGAPVAATPMTNYHFVKWSDESTDNPRTDLSITQDIKVYAEFAINTFMLSYLSTENGIIDGEAIQEVTVGANGITVVAIPNSDYLFSQWNDGVTDNPRTDTNVQADVNAIAQYILKSFNCAYVAGDNGSLTGDLSQDVSIHSNTTPVTAIPDAEYKFNAWSDGVTNNPRIDVNVEKGIGVIAIFAPDGYVFTYVAGDNGKLTGTTTQIVKEGNDGTAVTAVADTNYVFYGWNDSVYDNPRTDISASSDIDVTAEFAVGDYIVNYDASIGGRIQGDPRQPIVSGADAATVIAVANSGYVFNKWSDNDSFVATRQDEGIVADLTTEAEFELGDYILNYDAGDNGILSGTERQFVAENGSGSAIQAVADSGFVFDQWSDGVLTAVRTDIDVTNNVSVTANFVAE